MCLPQSMTDRKGQLHPMAYRDRMHFAFRVKRRLQGIIQGRLFRLFWRGKMMIRTIIRLASAKEVGRKF